MLPARPTTLDKGKPVAVSINSNLVSLVEDYENRLEICKLGLDSVPLLQTLCFLELPPLAPGASNLFFEAVTEWVPTSNSYAGTRSSRRCQLPFYSSAIGTIALRLRYQLPPTLYAETYALIINVAALVSAISTDACNIPWEDWGPSCTHFYGMAPTRPTSVGPFWATDFQSLAIRQYDLRPTRYTRDMAMVDSYFETRPSLHSASKFKYNINTYMPYRDVKVKHEDLRESTYIVADREWVVGVTDLVRGSFVHIFGIFPYDSDYTH